MTSYCRGKNGHEMQHGKGLCRYKTANLGRDFSSHQSRANWKGEVSIFPVGVMTVGMVIHSAMPDRRRIHQAPSSALIPPDLGTIRGRTELQPGPRDHVTVTGPVDKKRRSEFTEYTTSTGPWSWYLLLLPSRSDDGRSLNLKELELSMVSGWSHRIREVYSVVPVVVVRGCRSVEWDWDRLLAPHRCRLPPALVHGHYIIFPLAAKESSCLTLGSHT